MSNTLKIGHYALALIVCFTGLSQDKSDDFNFNFEKVEQEKQIPEDWLI